MMYCPVNAARTGSYHAAEMGWVHIHEINSERSTHTSKQKSLNGTSHREQRYFSLSNPNRKLIAVRVCLQSQKCVVLFLTLGWVSLRHGAARHPNI